MKSTWWLAHNHTTLVKLDELLLDVPNNSIELIAFNFRDHNHLTHLTASNYVCIDESFEGYELNDVLQQKVKSC